MISSSRRWVKTVNRLGSVIRFTFWSQARTKGYKIGTIFFVILITVGMHVPLIIQALSSGKPAKVGVLPETSGIAAALQQFYAMQEEPKIEIIPIEDQGSAQANEQLAKEMMFADELDGYLVFPKRGDQSTIASEAEYRAKKVRTKVLEELQSALHYVRLNIVAQHLQLSAEQLADLNTPFIVQSVHVSENDEGKSDAQIAATVIFVFVMLSMLFGSTFGGGSMVASEVSAEKSSRVMEILITSVKPLVQMFGKIIGVFLVGFLQLLIYAATVIVNLLLPYNRDAFAAVEIDLSALSFSLLGYFILFYLIGYFSYAVMFAGAGSIVSRTEDLGHVLSPIMILSLVTFYVALLSVSNADAMYVEILSFVPLFSPVLMFLRIGMSDPAWWEVGAALLVNFAFIGVVGWLAAKVYRAGVLMYGNRPSMKDLWKIIRYD